MLFHPDFQPRPFWWEAWRPGDDSPADLPVRTDVAIVGGGYTGLSAALELARAGVAAAVIEAHDFGHGASTRNGGHVSGGINLSKGLTARRGRYRAGGKDPDLSKRATAALLTDAAASFDCVEAIIAREQIHCCYERSGRFIGAYAARHYDTFARRVEILNRHTNAGASLVPRDGSGKRSPATSTTVGSRSAVPASCIRGSIIKGCWTPAAGRASPCARKPSSVPYGGGPEGLSSIPTAARSRPST